MRAISLTVNGQATSAEIEPRTNLADFLREHLTLTGTHVGCEHGVCGACTVLIDGAPARSCITFAAACDGAEVTTIEGLDSDSVARRLREEFSLHHGLQCGYCTPGMLVTSRDIVLRIPDADDRRIREELAGNLCRCTGYVGIVKAIKAVISAPDGNGDTLAARTLGPVGAGHAPAEQIRSRAPERIQRQAAPASVSKAPDLSSEDWRTVEEQGTELTQSFTIAHPRDRVWAFFADPHALARCMPGASLTNDGADGTLNGEIVVKLGPMVAAFAGVAEMERDDSAYRGMVRGHGRDQKSSSRARGMVSYELKEQGPQSTRVDVRVKFLLAGSLAQFSRTGLVHDIANQITTAFARNLEARLSGEEKTDQSAAPLDAGNLAWKALWARLKAAVGRLLGGRK
jgi:aerobic carbon-monoxide dehydrogenase small subunit